MGDESAQRLLELLALDNHVDHPVFQQKLGSLKLVRQLLLDGLFDHPRPGKPDQSLRFGNDDVAKHRSEEHTSELQSQSNLVCRLLLEKKKEHNRTLRLNYRHCYKSGAVVVR